MALSKIVLVSLALISVFVLSKATYGRSHDPCHHNNCHKDAKCLPWFQRYRCVCKQGYSGNGYKCQRIDPCKKFPYPCSLYATCTVEHYKPVCRCKPGYTGDGKWCKYDQCYNKRCPPYSTCKPNILFGARCICDDGYYPNGKQCVAKDSCFNRCGRYLRGFPCQCNSSCKHYGNCCSDYKQYCDTPHHYGH